MDATSRPRRHRTSASRSTRRRATVSDILERAEQLSAADIRALASAYRGETRAGQQDADERRRAHRRATAVGIAIKRSGRADEARAAQESASVAVRAAADRAGLLGGRTMGVIGDAELAVGDAALASLLADHFSAEIAALLREPFDRVTGTAADAPREPDR